MSFQYVTQEILKRGSVNLKISNVFAPLSECFMNEM